MALSSHFGFTLLLLTFLLVMRATSAETQRRRQPEKLLVFGDSYVDTGNAAKALSSAWREPYGITFPGRPAGRFSDGRVLTDYIASFLGIKSPIPYNLRRSGKKLLPYGMNFAIGGSGVFDTVFLQANLTVQIDRLREQMVQGVFSMADLRSSVAVVCSSSNDYITFQALGGTLEGLPEFIPKVIDQLKQDSKRLHEMGVAKVALTNLDPLGCIPPIAAASASHGRRCNTTINRLVSYHNRLLLEAVRDLNKNAPGSPFAIINLHRAFASILKQDTKRFPSVLEPCCRGRTSQNQCGDIDADGNKLYTVCSRRDSYFFWDDAHPTQAGWSAAFSNLGQSLRQVLII